MRHPKKLHTLSDVLDWVQRLLFRSKLESSELDGQSARRTLDKLKWNLLLGSGLIQ